MCEKCWADAARAAGPYGDQVDEYRRLCRERKDNPCTPEEQAGPDAEWCPVCGRKTLHQHTGQCMTHACT